MQNAIARIEFPELFFGIVSPVGAETAPAIQALTDYFTREKYRVVHIKVTDYFGTIAKTIKPEKPLDKFPTDRRIESYIQYGN
ncbi:MAG TPA: dCMP deaminase, partial [Rhizobiaceae bacterium]